MDRPVRSITHLTQETNSLFDPAVAFARIEKEYRVCIEQFLDTHHGIFTTLQNQFGHCLIHGDIIQKNIILTDDRLGLIDFDECAFAPPLFEVAITLRHWRDHKAWHDIFNDYLRGYNEWFDISEELQYLDYYIGLRHVLLCLWVAFNSSHNPQIEAIKKETLENGCNFLARL